MREWTQKHIEELISSIFDKKIKPYAEAIQFLYENMGTNNQTTSVEGGNQDETE